MLKSRYLIENNFSNGLELATDERMHANVNPLAYHLKMSKLRWLRTFLLSVSVFPIRVILTLIILLIQYIVVVIGIIGLKKEKIGNVLILMMQSL